MCIRDSQIPLPDKESRQRILEINAEEVPFEKDPNSPDYVNFSKLAEATDGFSGADVAAIANTAVSFVIHEHLDKYAMGGQTETKDTEIKVTEKKIPTKNADLIVEEKEARAMSVEDEKVAKDKEEKEISKVEKAAENAKVTMKHFEDAIKKVREQKDLKIGQKVELSAFR